MSQRTSRASKSADAQSNGSPRKPAKPKGSGAGKPRTPPSTKKVRLVKVIVQPVVVVTDTASPDFAEEIRVDAQTVPASQWRDYPTTGFEEGMESLRAQIERGQRPVPVVGDGPLAE